MKKIKILITGSGGQLGSSIIKKVKHFQNFEIHSFTKDELDILDADYIENIFSKEDYHYCINAAAYTNVDQAEKEPERCFNVNAKGPENLAISCKKHNCVLIHISSDYVYHPDNDLSLSEETPTSPKGIYAQSKLEGEVRISDKLNNYIILRTSWVYGHGGNNFVKTMLRLGSKHQELKVVSDQIGSPTFSDDLAECCLELILKIENTPDFNEYGIYNFSNEGLTSWYNFAKLIFKLSNKKILVLPIPSRDYPTLAERPLNSRMNKSKITKLLGKEPRNWKIALREYMEDIS